MKPETKKMAESVVSQMTIVSIFIALFCFYYGREHAYKWLWVLSGIYLGLSALIIAIILLLIIFVLFMLLIGKIIS